MGVARGTQVTQVLLDDADLAVPRLAGDAPVQWRHEETLVQRADKAVGFLGGSSRPFEGLSEGTPQVLWYELGTHWDE